MSERIRTNFMSTKPQVSIVMATYNRSNIIGYSIRSVLASHFQDWELIVVGDACTDDTQEVVRTFGDPRIRYACLEKNFGEQSGPNNHGVSLARGEYIAFLNHDDFWLPDHLTHALAVLKNTDADLVFSIGLLSHGGPRGTLMYGALTEEKHYHARLSIPASLWVFRRQLAEKIGDWKPARETVGAPSQEWLYRTYRSGARMVPVRKITALLIPSGNRRNSYQSRMEEEHRRSFASLHDPNFLLQSLLQHSLKWEDARFNKPRFLFTEACVSLGRYVLHKLGIFPTAPGVWILAPFKGAAIKRLRKIRGLPPMGSS